MTDFQQGPQVLVLAILLLCVLVWRLWIGRYLVSARDSHAESEERAGSLLREILSDRQEQQLEQSGYLTVPSGSVEGRYYRVPARPGWVDVYESDRLAMRVCVEPLEQLPVADVVLMHKLMIEGNEKDYLRQANIVFVRPPAGQKRRNYNL